MAGIGSKILDILRPLDEEGNPLPMTTVEVKLSKEAKKDLAIGGSIFLVASAILTGIAFNISK